jgi:hypothetical protein
MITERSLNRTQGCARVIGALLFFAGDMLFYGHWGPGSAFHDGMMRVLAGASLTRLFLGGLVGPIAACLCLIGCWHVRANVITHSTVLGRIAFYSFAAMMVFGGAVHALWVPRGLAMKYSFLPEAPRNNYLNMRTQAELSGGRFQLVRDTTYSFMEIISTGATGWSCPWWMARFSRRR